MEYRILDPVDVLFLRGNQLFGDPGSHGEALVPPWPSVAAGALRSRMLVDEGIDLARFARGEVNHPELGTPTEPGSFAVAALHLARRGTEGWEVLVAPPADLVLFEAGESRPSVARSRLMQPRALHSGLQVSTELSRVPTLAQASERDKPASGFWLTASGWARYLAGEAPEAADLIHASQLWQLEDRVGIGLDGATGSVADGRLFTAQAVAFQEGVGLLVGVQGARPPREGLLRLGGDGRAVQVLPVDPALPRTDTEALLRHRRCRLVLTTPGLFAEGWLPTGVVRQGENLFLDLHGVRGRLVAAAVARSGVISGWDLAARRPKPAQRTVPTGSVYWLEDLEATPEALDKLVEQGLWSEPCEDASRRAEGFNRLVLAPWAGDRSSH